MPTIGLLTIDFLPTLDKKTTLSFLTATDRDRLGKREGKLTDGRMLCSFVGPA